VLAHVADTFVNKGYVRSDPFEPSPAVMAELDAQVADLLNKPLDMQAALNAETSEDVVTLQNKVASLESEIKQQTERLEAHVEALKKGDTEYVTPELLLETDAGLRAGLLLNGLKKAGKFLMGGAKKLMGAGKKVVAAGKRAGAALNGDLDKAMGQRLEDCVACRYVWKQVEMDVSNARYIEDVQASFEHNCLDAQKATIFYKACEDMYDDMYAMTDDYMSSDFTVDQMCQRANMCKL